ncbi:DHH family phosphoesterase [Geochorda subterranea]|uniref:Bifunctional oligoribonuclease/PAP phosphatase NrnA n=1 Tax=Geochorda subterranea TaxID=3109564 RepID=A0ABZ1BKH5_9FIRM|nr:bifunctional oligoribonuclease/PAP phosphatase NrnA [Limnochorda sp. LNt]WRP13298.1 bifunctional oligoribonuclease/PAP phosphatase NrnA [Limnochorda sp. LNt]
MSLAWPEVERRLGPLVEALRGADRIAVLGHVNPDLDSIGSVLALHLALAAAGKTSWPVTPDPGSPYWAFLPGHDRLVVGAPEWLRPDAVAVLDTEIAPERLGQAWALVERAALRLNLDHHDTNRGGADAALVEPAAAATGELVFYLVRALGVPVTPEIAACLYAAILTDTGSFRYANTTARTLALASALVATGVEPHEMATRIYDTRSWAYMKLLGRLLSRLERTEDGKVAWMWVRHEDAVEAGLLASEVEGLAQYPRMVEGVEVALLFKETEPGVVRVSLRSQRFVDVAAIARAFGGGGHVRAAGCTLTGSLEQAIERLVQACRQAVQREVMAGEGAGTSCGTGEE